MPAASILIKPVSGRCNLACSYCFYRDVAAHRDLPDYGRMSLETAKTLIHKALDYAEGRCSFAFQGGEPTLAGLDFFRTFVDTVERADRGKAVINYMLQTNGLAIDEEWAAFLAEKHFLTGLSLDGPRLLHDLFRKGYDGSGSFDRVMQAARTLKAAGADFNILCVVDAATADNPLAVYEFFRRRGFDWIQYIPCLEPLEGTSQLPVDASGVTGEDAVAQDSGSNPGAAARSGGGSPYALTPAAWGHFLEVTFDAWYKDIRSGRQVSIRYFDNLVDMALGYPPENCGMAGRCSAYFTVEADGSVYPCDFYVLDEWRMGNVQEHSFAQMAASKEARRFIESSLSVSPECTGCFAYPLCRGGCRREREPFIDGHPGLNRHCEAWQHFFRHAGGRIMELAADLQRADAEGMK